MSTDLPVLFTTHCSERWLRVPLVRSDPPSLLAAIQTCCGHIQATGMTLQAPTENRSKRNGSGLPMPNKLRVRVLESSPRMVRSALP